MTTKKLNHRQVQWLLYLARFEFKLHHYPGHSISKSDILSQRLYYSTRSHNNEDMILIKLKFLAIQVLEGMAIKSEKKTLLRNIYQANQLRKQEKPIAKAVYKLQQLPTRFVHTIEWSKSKSLFLYQDKVYIANVLDLYYYIVSLYHNLRIIEHVEQ